MSTASSSFRRFYFDLTELKVGSRGKHGFYGIARVVAELAEALGACSRDRAIGVEQSAGLATPDGGAPLPNGFLIHRHWRRSFQLAGLESVSVADLDSLALRLESPSLKGVLGPGVLVSAARPRLLAGYGPALVRQRLQLVPLIHDLFPLVDEHDQPSSRFRRRFLAHNRWLLARAPLVLANSQCTAAALRDCHRQGLLPTLPPVAVLPLAHEFGASGRSLPTPAGRGDVAREAPGLPDEPYVLLVGPRLGRRNLQVVLAALALLRASDQPAPLVVLAGAKRRSTARALTAGPWRVIQDRVMVLPTPDQAELRRLYAGALALVMPSFLEGWGLPAAEALWLGTPVLAADIPVMHEVCGALARYFPPDRPESLAALLAALLTDPAGQAAWAASVAVARPQLRSWKQVGVELGNIIAPMLRAPPDCGSG